MDVLSDLLRVFHLKAHVFLHSQFYGAWRVDTSGEQKATFHLVTRGVCWLHLPSKDVPIPLRAGDLVVFPHDAVHTITHSQDTPDLQLELNQPNEEGQASGRAATSLICGYFELDHFSWNPLHEDLPEVLIVQNDLAEGAALIETVTRFITFEIENNLPGEKIAIDRLSEILFIYIVRAHMKSSQFTDGYIKALADPKLGKVLQSIHSDPGYSWTVDKLSKLAAMSRSSFSEKFLLLVKKTPMQYVTNWRMQRAHQEFYEKKNSTAQVAHQFGYQSEASFSKAFKKHFGYGPGAARRKGIES
ncbi:AraC family transcriptional regulator [Microbulbifer sp. CNSA002]|uniref:AraC family transcriptional regulator n=1 Tax=Microbulbifer sp. CNSA002 TaxID=3373604 RepID=UPI0039B5ECC1